MQIWKRPLTKQELAEISGIKTTDITPLPEELEQFIDFFERIDDLHEHVANIKANLKHRPDMFWVNSAVMRALALMHHIYLAKYRTQNDLMKCV
ncbi:hypothetical protein BJV82DRAFT_667989 [Fennellomyces sp. T-0311]|nr:hypothetical protein BJV82DRAFT_667989 [Fennellomyces sp. T-0311]